MSPVELVDATLARIEKLEPKLGAFMHLDAAGARKQARAAEDAVARGGAAWAAAWRADDDQVQHRCCGIAVSGGIAAARGLCAEARRATGGAVACGGRDYFGEYEHAGIFDGVGERQSDSREDEQSVESGALGGGIERRRSGGDFVGMLVWGSGERRRRIDSRAGAFLRDLRVEADAGARAFDGTLSRPGAGALSWLGVVGPMARTIADVRAMFEVIAGPDAGDALSAPVPIADAASVSERLKRHSNRCAGDGCVGEGDDGNGSGGSSARRKFWRERDFAVEPFRLDGLDRVIDCWWFFFGPVVAQSFYRYGCGARGDTQPDIQGILFDGAAAETFER